MNLIYLFTYFLQLSSRLFSPAHWGSQVWKPLLLKCTKTLTSPSSPRFRVSIRTSRESLKIQTCHNCIIRWLDDTVWFKDLIGWINAVSSTWLTSCVSGCVQFHLFEEIGILLFVLLLSDMNHCVCHLVISMFWHNCLSRHCSTSPHSRTHLVGSGPIILLSLQPGHWLKKVRLLQPWQERCQFWIIPL